MQNGYSAVVNWRRTVNTMAKWQKDK